jgi:hypothetical protein
MAELLLSSEQGHLEAEVGAQRESAAAAVPAVWGLLLAFWWSESMLKYAQQRM